MKDVSTFLYFHEFALFCKFCQANGTVILLHGVAILKNLDHPLKTLMISCILQTFHTFWDDNKQAYERNCHDGIHIHKVINIGISNFERQHFLLLEDQVIIAILIIVFLMDTCFGNEDGYECGEEDEESA